MREILFRGRTKDGEWRTGWYVKANQSMGNGKRQHEDWIVGGFSALGGWLAPLSRYAVEADTVGQYTGLKDKNGGRIFEGDIVSVDNALVRGIFLVEYGNSASFICVDSEDRRHFLGGRNCEVIGNIYDNPELI